EDAGVGEIELTLAAPAPRVLVDQAPVRKRGLRILVERLHVRVRRRRIQVEVLLLHVLAVVALRAGEAEQALLQDRIVAVPHREREAQPPLAIADAEDAVLAPAVR